MSVVAVKLYAKHFEMSCDSIMIHYGSSQTKNKTFNFSKMFRTDQMVIGCVGAVAEITALSLFLKEHKLSEARIGEESLQQMLWAFQQWYKEKFSKEELTNDVFFGTPFGVWCFTGLSGLQIKNHFAIGAGMDFANGALAMGANSRKACEIACDLSAWCEMPILTEKMKFA